MVKKIKLKLGINFLIEYHIKTINTVFNDKTKTVKIIITKAINGVVPILVASQKTTIKWHMTNPQKVQTLLD